MFEYEKRSSYKTMLFVQLRLDAFPPDYLRVVGLPLHPLESDNWLLLGYKEIDLVELGFDIPTAEAVQQLVEEWKQRQGTKERVN